MLELPWLREGVLINRRNDPTTAVYVSNEELLPFLACLIAEAAGEPEHVREVQAMLAAPR